jgi:hypothetical protein
MRQRPCKTAVRTRVCWPAGSAKAATGLGKGLCKVLQHRRRGPQHTARLCPLCHMPLLAACCQASIWRASLATSNRPSRTRPTQNVGSACADQPCSSGTSTEPRISVLLIFSIRAATRGRAASAASAAARVGFAPLLVFCCRISKGAIAPRYCCRSCCTTGDRWSEVFCQPGQACPIIACQI